MARKQAGNSKPRPVFLPGKFHGQQSLLGYSPWGHKEWNTTGAKHTQGNNNRSWKNDDPCYAVAKYLAKLSPIKI